MNAALTYHRHVSDARPALGAACPICAAAPDTASRYACGGGYRSEALGARRIPGDTAPEPLVYTGFCPATPVLALARPLGRQIGYPNGRPRRVTNQRTACGSVPANWV